MLNLGNYIGGRPHQRLAMKPKASKVPPSKWDDADKWIASPSHNDSPATPSFRLISQGLAPGPWTQPGAKVGYIHSRIDKGFLVAENNDQNP